MKSFLLALACAATLSTALYTSSDAVVELTDANFDAKGAWGV